MASLTRESLHRMILEARACLAEGKTDQAASLCQTVLDNDASALGALVVLARVRLHERDPAAALSLVQRGLDAVPGDAHLLSLRQRVQADLDRKQRIEVQQAAQTGAERLIADLQYTAAAELLVSASPPEAPSPGRRYLQLLAEAGRLDWALFHVGRWSFQEDVDRRLLVADLNYAAGEVEAALEIVTQLGGLELPKSDVLRRCMHWSATMGLRESAAHWAERYGQSLSQTDFVRAASVIAGTFDHAGRSEQGKEIRKRGCALAGLLPDGSGAAVVYNLHMQMFDLSAAENAARRLARDDAERDQLLAHTDTLRGRVDYMHVHRFADLEIDDRPADLTFFVRGSINTYLESANRNVEPDIAQQVFGRAFRMAQDAGLGVRVVGAGKGVDLPNELADVRSVLSYLTIGGRDALHTKMGPLTGTVLFDKGGYAGWATAADTPFSALPLHDIDPAMASQWIASERLSRLHGNTSKLPQADRTQVDFSGSAVLVALQKPTDTVMAHARIDLFAMLSAVVERYSGTGTLVVVKRHPLCWDPRVAAILIELSKQPHVRLSKASIHDLLPAVQAVYVVNSGVGAEALLYGKSVHVCGKADYRHACHEVFSVRDILDCRDPFTPPLPSEEMARYMWWYTHVNHVWLADPGALDAALDRMLIQPALQRRKTASAAGRDTP